MKLNLPMRVGNTVYYDEQRKKIYTKAVSNNETTSDQMIKPPGLNPHVLSFPKNFRVFLATETEFTSSVDSSDLDI